MNTRMPVPLLLAVAVAVGTAVTLIIQIEVMSTGVPAILFPLEVPDTGATGSVTVTVYSGQRLRYATVSFGNFTVYSNTTWYYDVYGKVGTLVRRSTGDANYSVARFGVDVQVKELNSTHALLFITSLSDYVVVARKVAVGGWYVYVPTYSNLASDTRVRSAILSWLSATGKYAVGVFQLRQDYFIVGFYGDGGFYTDALYNDGTLHEKYSAYYAPATQTVGTRDSPTAIDATDAAGADAYYLAVVLIWSNLYVNGPVVSELSARP